MSNPLSNVRPPAALPSFVTQSPMQPAPAGGTMPSASSVASTASTVTQSHAPRPAASLGAQQPAVVSSALPPPATLSGIPPRGHTAPAVVSSVQPPPATLSGIPPRGHTAPAVVSSALPPPATLSGIPPGGHTAPTVVSSVQPPPAMLSGIPPGGHTAPAVVSGVLPPPATLSGIPPYGHTAPVVPLVSARPNVPMPTGLVTGPRAIGGAAPPPVGGAGPAPVGVVGLPVEGTGPPPRPSGTLPPPPMGSGAGPLSATAAGHFSRPKYVAPPDLATTGSVGPAPLCQVGAVTGFPLPPAQLDGSGMYPAAGGVTVDYAETPSWGGPATSPASAGAGSAESGWLGWLKDTVQKSDVLTKVAERARTSMDSMITTLDPQMRDIIYSGGDLDIVVASDKEVKVSAVREAFQTVFGKATVVGVPVPGRGLVPQPVGWQGGWAAAEARLQTLRTSGLVPTQQTVVAVEGFIVQLEPERWYDMSLLLLDEPGVGRLSALSQPTAVPTDWVQRMEAASPADQPQRHLGLQLTVGQLAESSLQASPAAWHEVMAGVTRRELLLMAARVLAHQYRTRRGS